MAPAAMNMGSQDSITVRPIHASPSTRRLKAVTHVPIMKGASVPLTRTRPSAQNFPRSGGQARPAERPRRARALAARRVERRERLGGGDAAREAELLDVDHLALHGDRHGHAEHGKEEHPREHVGQRHRGPVDEHVRGEGGDERPARGIARRARRRLHAVVLEDGHGRARHADPEQGRPDGVRKDARGDGDAEAPARLEPDVEIGEGEHAAECRAHEHGPPRELRHAVAAAPIDLLVPLPLDLLGGARESADGQRARLVGTLLSGHGRAPAGRGASASPPPGRQLFLTTFM